MYGKNEVSGQRHAAQTFQVKDIFYTIQGEGPHAGRPAVFVRLGGCNLRCTFCDTDFSSDLVEMGSDAITGEIFRKSQSCPLIVITGGEPMLQNLAHLIEVIDANLPHVSTVQIETAGTVWAPGLEHWVDLQIAEIVVSPKTPHVHSKIMQYAEHWKYIVTAVNFSLEDGLPFLSTQPGEVKTSYLARPPANRDINIFVQPMDEYDHTLNKANLKAASRIAMQWGYRISLQQHKILDLP